MIQRAAYIWIVLSFNFVLIFGVDPRCMFGKVGGRCHPPPADFFSTSRQTNIPLCQSKQPYGKTDLRESDNPSIFRDLTSKEIEGVLHFLYSRSDLNLTRSNVSRINTNYIYLANIHLPPKAKALNYLDRQYRKPAREAHVIIFRGAIPKPDVIEIIVGPLPYPTRYRHIPYYPKSLPFYARPPTFTENILPGLHKRVDKVLGDMLFYLYGGRLINCRRKCIGFNFGSLLSPALSGENKRRSFHWLVHFVEYYLLRPLDFVVLTERESNTNFKILKIYFDGLAFDKLENVLYYYQTRKSSIKRVPFPKTTRKSPLTVNARGKYPFSRPLKNPTQVSPDGKRYTIIDRKVVYTDWSFDIGMSVFTGARLNDIRYKNERIAYEISIQDLANFYSGYRPFEYTMNFLDARFNIGLGAKFLMPGVDCPDDATFIGSLFKIELKDQPEYNAHAFCVFEWNTGTPLRRHSGYYRYAHSFYEGVESVVLVVRTIPTISMYDYVTDFIFYQNGVIEVKLTPTGVVASTWFNEKNPYSFQLHENLMSPMHQHLFHIKMDLDIKGTSNRFETLDIESDMIRNEVNKNTNAYVVQDRFVKRLKSTEKEAAYRYNLDTPTYLTFVNDKKKDKFGNSPGYRVVNKGMSKNLRPTGLGNGPGISWSQYQVAVTKYKDSEPRSTSKYAISDNTFLNFQNFIDDNENIVDEDLVTWVSMGFHHIPQKEDLPLTHTPGLSLSTYLMPYNYFDESPGMSAANAVRIDPKDRKGSTVGVNVRRFGVDNNVDCIPKKNPILEILDRNPCLALQCISH